MDVKIRRSVIYIDFYKISISDDAKEELKQIYYYIAMCLKEENIARKLINKIRKEILRLQYFPKENKVIFRQGKKELYRLIVKNYIIIYQIDIKIKTVYILHIFNSKQNYLKII